MACFLARARACVSVRALRDPTCVVLASVPHNCSDGCMFMSTVCLEGDSLWLMLYNSQQTSLVATLLLCPSPLSPSLYLFFSLLAMQCNRAFSLEVPRQSSPIRFYFTCHIFIKTFYFLFFFEISSDFQL